MENQNDNEKFLSTMRHSCAHVMAQAVVELFPGTKLGIGPAIENGFYYDFDSKHKFTPEDLDKISAKMKEIIKAKQPFECSKLKKADAIRKFDKQGEEYKKELIGELPDDEVTIYSNGDFADLCRGPHLRHTGEIRHFKLTHIAGAYWRGDESRPMLQRIYALAFKTKDELDAHIKQMEEAAKRDHRKLGTELKLFSIREECGPGLVLWLPKGALIRRVIEDWVREENFKRGYDIVFTPHIARYHLWETSGHASFYSENMYSPMDVDNQKYQIKPMNCPFHILVYNNELRSYRNLPLRLFELGTLYRYEKSGVVHGLLRARGFTQDDAHIFCTAEQVESEVSDCLDFTLHVFKTFGFDKYQIELSTWDDTKPQDYSGNAKDWDMAQKALEKVLKDRKIPYKVEKGEAAFYGPKIDIKLIDAIGRPWQLTTIQFDFNLSEKFKLEYVAEKGRKRPYMVHRALLGSVERFFGILVEHYAGLFPLWLSPVQCKVLTLTSEQEEYGKKIVEKMKQAGIRAELDDRPEKIGLKIREAHNEKVPYSIVIGAKEAEQNVVTLRLRNGKNLNDLSVDEIVRNLSKENTERLLENVYK
jgi:threonyl-tRNA synthetase